MKYLPVLLFLLSSCASWHCRKCYSNADVKRDTLILHDTLMIASIQVDTVIQYDLSTDTLVIEKDRVKIKYRDLPGPTIYLAAECPADTVIREIKIPVEIPQPRTGFTFWQILLACLATAGLVALLFLLRRR